MHRLGRLAACIAWAIPAVLAQDHIGFWNGTFNFTTQNFDVSLIKDSGTLASLRPAGSDFDFLPYDYFLKNRRIQNGCYHFGDINIRFRESCSGNWTDGNSAAERTPIEWLEDTEAIAAHDLSPTMDHGPFSITREWIDVDGDLGLQFTLENTGNSSIELGSLGFPAAVNNIFTDRKSDDMYKKCSFMDPYIGLDAGYLQVTPISGISAALVITSLSDTPLEAYRFLPEDNRGGTRIESNGWEGYYEWQVHTKAWAKNEWANADPWNPPTTTVFQPGEKRQYGVRFTVVQDGVRGIAEAVKNLDVPTATAVPGYVLGRDTNGYLYLESSSEVASVTVEPSGAISLTEIGDKSYLVEPSESAWGRVRVAIEYEDGRLQTVHYYITKSPSEAISDLGRFLTTEQWLNDASDPFGRAPSPMGYDHDEAAIVDQELRVWVAGLSDEGGAGAYASAMVKQAFLPNADEISKLETFVDEVLFKTVQDEDYAVKRSTFFYEPEVVPDYNYSSGIDWTSRTYDRDFAYEINRAYNYVWPAASYWAFYRVARSYPDLMEKHDWEWYLDQAFKTVMRGMQPDIGYNKDGLMGETVFGEILSDLKREGKNEEAGQLEDAMRARVDLWLTEAYPFGSEMAWDSTGQEGVYYWCRHFGKTEMQDRARDSVLGYMPTVAHWGYNGNARRYWDFVVTGKLQIVERQIHHYGSALNALALLASFRDDPTDSYLIRVGYAGTSAPLSNIHSDGFASCAMHARPEHLSWDAYSGDYGPAFVGLALGSGTYLVDDADLGLISYGGNLEREGDNITVEVRDAVKQKIFIGPLGLEIQISAAIIESFSYNTVSHQIKIRIGQLDDAPKTDGVVVWVFSSASGANARRAEDLSITMDGGGELEEQRGGRFVPLESDVTTIEVNY